MKCKEARLTIIDTPNGLQSLRPMTGILSERLKKLTNALPVIPVKR